MTEPDENTSSDDDENSSPSSNVPEEFGINPNKELSDPELALLLRDHESVGEDARYRDQLIHTGFYLSLIFAGILLDTGVRLLGQERFLLLSAVSAFGALAYYILWIWTESFTGARNATWDRRRQIEYELNKDYGGLLKGHGDLFNRLEFDRENEKFEHVDRSGREALSAGNLTHFLIKVEFSSAALISVATFWYATTLRLGSQKMGTALTVSVYVVAAVIIVKVSLGRSWKEMISTIYGWISSTDSS